MHFNCITLSLAAAAFVQAGIQFDSDEIPRQCNAVCRPIFSLTQACKVNDNLVNNLTKDQLEAQCVCTNNSINVAQYAALCASCTEQNIEDVGDVGDLDDGSSLEKRLLQSKEVQKNTPDINDIMRTCGFASTLYVATASYASTTPSVSAARLSNSAHLTTTITPGSSASYSSRNNNNNNGGSSNATPTNGNQATQTPNAAGIRKNKLIY
ncbi:CAP22 protein [Colletotrichum higginsianum IMI 349063]|uniref:CAP22 protein n=1 Tax=Colletotrichum higginsianum (strain IMI 349063) TaxID=759273 RepID=A0A1B7XX22_COLHI|nr:CAP22 protein [Colletotrichum higginsianum IMI 349063]OBR04316.1 CAP22 protein [Colletotrichum higginsianum IMI 349063]